MNNPNTQPNQSSTNKNNFASTGMKSDSSKSDSSLQDKIMQQIRDLGDSIERAGEKVERSGWESIGQALYRLGDKLEHFNGGKSFRKDSASNTASDRTVS